MDRNTRNTVQSLFPPTPEASPHKHSLVALESSPSRTSNGDGFTLSEIEEARKPKPIESWHPATEYAERDIRDLCPGPGAMTFMGRVAGIYDTTHNPKTPRSAKGCMKLCVKDNTGAMTVRYWYVNHKPAVKLGSLLSVWTTHVSNGENGNLSSATAPLFTSLFPERDRTCHLMVHENSDHDSMCRKPLGLHKGEPLDGLMSLKSFADGGHDVVAAKIIVVVFSVDMKKQVTRKDGTVIDNVNVHIRDDTSEATLGLWGTAAESPFHHVSAVNSNDSNAIKPELAWNSGETILLLQAPTCRPGRVPYLTLSSSSMIDVDPIISDAQWLRTWSLRQRSCEAINPPFPEGIFDFLSIVSGPVRCLYTLRDLDDFARAAPADTFQGYLSVVIMESRLLDCWKRGMLCAGDCCCGAPIYANVLSTICKGCEKPVKLRLNPRIIGQVIDETGCVSPGKLLVSDRAWQQLLGVAVENLCRMSAKDIGNLSHRMAFCRVSLMFGWTGDATKAGGRICVLGVQN